MGCFIVKKGWFVYWFSFSLTHSRVKWTFCCWYFHHCIFHTREKPIFHEKKKYNRTTTKSIFLVSYLFKFMLKNNMLYENMKIFVGNEGGRGRFFFFSFFDQEENNTEECLVAGGWGVRGEGCENNDDLRLRVSIDVQDVLCCEEKNT